MEFNNEKKEREYQEQQRKREIERERDAEIHRRIEAERDEQHRRIEVERRNEFERERMERIPYWRNAVRSDEAIPFTAQSLINAIITENIQKPAEARERFLLVSFLDFPLIHVSRLLMIKFHFIFTSRVIAYKHQTIMATLINPTSSRLTLTHRTATNKIQLSRKI